MAERVTDDDLDLLGELGVETESAPVGGRTAKEQRIIAGFEEIERWIEEHGRLPQHGENRDIFERLYAVRLDRLRESAECRGILSSIDKRNLLGQENEGRIDAEPEAQPAIPLNAELAENFLEDPEPEPEVENLPLEAQIPIQNPCQDFHGLTPLWVESLETWNQEPDQPIPYNGDRSFYNMSGGGSADRVLPIMVRKIARNEIEGRIAINRIMDFLPILG